MNRTALNSLLVRLGVDEATASRLAIDRAQKKAVARLQKNGIPKELTADEGSVVTELGITIPATTQVVQGAPAPAPAAPAAQPKNKRQRAEAKAEGKGKGKASSKDRSPEAPAQAEKGRGGGGLEFFRKVMAGRKSIAKDELFAKLTGEGGVSAVSASTYISDAQRLPYVLGYTVVIEKDKAGNKIVRKAEAAK